MAGKAHIVENVADNVDLTKKQAGDAVESVFDFITSTLAGGDRVQIPGFGSFSVSERAARKGRNPQTGKEITIPASKGARFKAGKGLKEAINS